VTDGVLPRAGRGCAVGGRVPRGNDKRAGGLAKGKGLMISAGAWSGIHACRRRERKLTRLLGGGGGGGGSEYCCGVVEWEGGVSETEGEQGRRGEGIFVIEQGGISYFSDIELGKVGGKGAYLFLRRENIFTQGRVGARR